MWDDEDDGTNTAAERAYQQAMSAETIREGELVRIYIPHEGTAIERTQQIEARRAGQKLWAQICDLLRKKVL